MKLSTSDSGGTKKVDVRDLVFSGDGSLTAGITMSWRPKSGAAAIRASMSPDEARMLAAYLIQRANEAEKTV